MYSGGVGIIHISLPCVVCGVTLQNNDLSLLLIEDRLYYSFSVL